MVSIYKEDISPTVIVGNLNRIQNQVFSLLPKREEGLDWVKPLETLTIEVSGMNGLFPENKDLFSLVCKMQGLLEGGDAIEFMLYRRTIFEACSLISKVKSNVD